MRELVRVALAIIGSSPSSIASAGLSRPVLILLWVVTVGAFRAYALVFRPILSRPVAVVLLGETFWL
jgi:hypothetical protein